MTLFFASLTGFLLAMALMGIGVVLGRRLRCGRCGARDQCPHREAA